MTTETAEPTAIIKTPLVRGLPLLGNVLDFARDPARFLVQCYRQYGPVFTVNLAGKKYTALAGIEAATFLGTREGRESLRSKEFWQGLVDEYGATRMLPGEDGESHKELRDVMKRGFSKEALKGQYNDLVRFTDKAIDRDWKPSTMVPALEAMQFMVTDQLGTILTGAAPLEYVKDIRTMILNILNVLVTRQRPKILLYRPSYKKAKARVFELSRSMIATWKAQYAVTPKRDEDKNVLDDIMETHMHSPHIIPEADLIMLATAPYVAGLDTVANTTSAVVYTVLKHPEVLKRVHAEVDALFAEGNDLEEGDLLKKIPSLQGAIMETMRLYPIAVVQMRCAAKDFVFQGHQIKEGQMLYMGTSVPHFMHEYFPDPDKFDIDRYQRPRAEHLQSGVYSPYGRGVHTCLGKGMAEILLALTMARVFYRLDLELPTPDYVLKTKTAPTPGPSMDFKVRVKGYRH